MKWMLRINLGCGRTYGLGFFSSSLVGSLFHGGWSPSPPLSFIVLYFLKKEKRFLCLLSCPPRPSSKSIKGICSASQGYKASLYQVGFVSCPPQTHQICCTINWKFVGLLKLISMSDNMYSLYFWILIFFLTSIVVKS